MNCLCCGKPLKNNNIYGWHKSCIKNFFNMDIIPELNLDKNTLEELTKTATNNGITVTGVQKKLSLHISSKSATPKLTIIDYPTGYILKPPVKEYKSLPEAEHLVMSMAKYTGISTVPFALLKSNNEFFYVTKRIDRIKETNTYRKIAMEDFCQLSLKLTEDKYKGSYEQCAKIIQKYSSQNLMDLSELYLRLLFCFIVGNSDMHLKNFSLIQNDDNKNLYILSPAYDLLPVNLVLPEDIEQFALTLNGKKNNIKKNDFIKFAKNIGINEKAAIKMIEKIVSLKDKYIDMVNNSFLSDKMKNDFIELILSRYDAMF